MRQSNKEDIKAEILHLIKSGRFPHAILIEGSEERTEYARFTASALLCMKPEAAPCGHCSACVKIKSLAHPDILESSGGGEARSFHIEKIRELRSMAYIIPNEADKKIFILHNTQEMSVQAQNALLKILEEPPAYLFFILTCDFKGSMLDTILSRSAVFSLRAAAESETNRAFELADKIAAAITAVNESELLTAAFSFAKDKVLLIKAMDALLLIIRDAAVLSAGSKALITGKRATAQKLAQALSLNQLTALSAAAERIKELANKNLNSNLLITLLSSELKTAAGR